MALLVNANSLLAWMTGAARDTEEMKRRMTSSYEGEFSDDVRRYDELCFRQHAEIAAALLDSVDVRGLQVADIGCGTGAEAFECLERGAERVVCTEVSGLMLDRCRQGARDRGYADDRIAFHLVDNAAGALESRAFDVSLSSMVLGLVPDQLDFVCEVARLARPGGVVALSAHGPDYDWQAVDAAFRGIPKRYVLGYRAEFWPLSATYLRSLLEKAGLTDIRTSRHRWDLSFDDPGHAFDFFSSSSSAFWSAKIPPDDREAVAAMMRNRFGLRAVLQVTHDIIFGYGRIPAS